MLTYTENRHISSAAIANPDVLRLYESWLSRRPTANKLPPAQRNLNELWCANDVMFLQQVAERDFHYHHYGANIARASGFTMEGKRTSDFNSEIGKFFIEKYVQTLAGGYALYTTHRAVHAKGVVAWERLMLPLADEGGKPHFLLVYNRPLAFASELLVSVLDGSPDTILALATVRDNEDSITDFTIELLNERGEAELGVRAADVLLHSATSSLPELFDTTLVEKCVEVVTSGRRCTFEHQQSLRGTIKYHRIALSPVTNGLVATLTDITALTETNARLVNLAMTDPLTGLANRRHFFDVAEREFKRGRRYGHPLSVLALDIDHFKHVNDEFGHAGGDAVLESFAHLLRAELREHDTIGRLGGEEFAVLLPQTPLADARALAERLRATIASSVVQTHCGAITVTASIGVTDCEQGEDNIESALTRADELLYAAKHQGRNRVCATAQCAALPPHAKNRERKQLRIV